MFAAVRLFFTSKSLSGVDRFVLLLTFLSPLPAFSALPNGMPFNGAIPGQFSVSPTGAATYGIPIEVPPGNGGVTPQLSLNYNSQSGNGLLGVGWSLSGLSSITRCSATLAQDGFIDGVDFDVNDRLCLDGQRLIAVANTGCSGGTEYRTEIDSDARVCAYGSQGNGPAWFKVWTKAGQVMEYGNTLDARVEAQGRSDVLVWALNRLSDAAGNYLQVSYQEDTANGEHYPLRIDYAGNDGQGMTLHHSVRFVYNQRPDTASGWMAGSVTRSSVRMTNIQIYAGATATRDYRLAYEAAAVTARSRLTSFIVCSDVGYNAECLPATALTWSAGAASFEPAIDMNGISTGYGYAQALDIDGDGKTDLAYCTSATSTWQIAISNGPGFNAPLNSSATCTGYQYALQIDYDADGKLDLLVPYANSRWYVLRSAGTGFSVVDTGIPDTGWDARPVIMDVNGDGRQDLVLNYNSQWIIRINNGNGFNAAVATGINNSNWQYSVEIDYDGDGMMDLLVPHANSRWYVLRSTGFTFQLIDTGISSTGYNRNPQAVDVNGDGLQDLILAYSDRTWIYFNTGGNFGPIVDAGVADVAQNGGRYSTTDFNGDGKVDLVVGYSVTHPCTPGRVCPTILWTRYRILQSNGSGFDLVDPGFPDSARSSQFRAGDFNGDGYADLLRDGYNLWSLVLHSPGIPDQLTSIANGQGNVINISYRPLTDDSVYTNGSATVVYPMQKIQTSLYVVSESSGSNGIGGFNAQSYTYTDARVDLSGRGFLGFQMVFMIDAVSRIRTQTVYSQIFPFMGMVISSETRLLNGQQPLTTLFNSLVNTRPFAGVYQPYAYATTQNSYEIDGAWVSSNQTVNSERDRYGNAGRIVVTTASSNETSTKTTVNAYANDAAQWHLGRLTGATVTSTSPSGTQTRTSAFEYDPTTGLLTAEIIEPDAPQLLLRTEYGYDAYGNRTSVTVRDSGTNTYPITAATSTTSYNYSQLAVNGTYTVSSTNAKGHTETQVIDARYGKPLSLTGPNGLTTQWQYDSFGRQVREIRADGTETIVSYTWCDSTCAGGLPNSVYKVTTQSTGSATTAVYIDNLGRELRSETVSLDGRPVYKDTQYDNLGQVAKVSRPYFAGDTPQWTDYLYDAIGRAWKETAADGGIVETTYSGLTTSIRRYSVNDAYNQTVTRIANVEGNLVESIDEGYQSTRYEYDPFGNLTRVTGPANNVTVMTYDLRGRKTAMDDPDMGHWEYQYDALGQLRWQKDAKNQIVTMKYDVLGRMTRREEVEGVSTWIYDTSPTPGIGKLWKVTGPNSYVEQHYYDSLGRPFIDNQTAAGVTLSTTTTYDGMGRINVLSYPGGFRLKHNYNADGYLEKLENADNASETYWTAQAMSPDGQIELELLGNGLTTVRTFDPASGRLNYLGTYGGTVNVQMLNYTYDALGNLKGREDAVRNLSETFQYDAFNRLTRADIAGVGIKTWGYDGLGNITSKDGYSDYAYGNGKPHAASYARGSTQLYDANGNLMLTYGEQSRSLSWNSTNLPVRIWANNTTAEFSYTPDGARYKQVSSKGGVSTTTLYVGKFYEQVSANGVVTHKHYIAAAGRVIAIRETVNTAVTLKYLHPDHLGSTDVITGANGQVLERQSYDAFGTRRVAGDWRDPIAWIASLYSTRGFTGHEMLDNVGLIHMNGRVYDPQLGRFLSADPIVKYPEGAQGLNRYSYVDNNPLSRVDPSGYGWLSKVWKGVKKVFKNPVVRAIAAIVAAPYVGFVVGSSLGLSTAAGYAISGFTAGFIASGGSLKAGAIGAVTALGFYGVGNYFQGISSVHGGALTPGQWGGKILAHGVVGGSSSRLSGGSFRDGFVSGGFTEFASPAIGTTPGGRTARVIAAAVVGGTAAELGGGKFANGATTAAFANLFSSGGVRQQGSGGGANGALDVAGKIWALPNTIIGAVYGGVGHIVGEVGYAFGVYDVSPSISIGNNAIQFLDNPFTISGTAITLGNTISYGRGTGPSYYGAYGDRSVQVGLHEQAHTYQYQALGPFFLPAYFISGGISGPAGNPFENAAQNYGRGTGGWWP